MKATAIALLLVSAYWIEQGIVAIQSQNTTQGIVELILAVLLLPIARYVWNKKLGGVKSVR